MPVESKAQYEGMLVYIDGNRNKSYEPQGLMYKNTVWTFTEDSVIRHCLMTNHKQTWYVTKIGRTTAMTIYFADQINPSGARVPMAIRKGHGYTELLEPVYHRHGKRISYKPHKIYFREVR